MSTQKRVNSLAEVYGKLIGNGNSESQEAEKHNKQNEWIWEYVLKNAQDFQLSTVLLEALPIPNTPMIKKLALLKLITLDLKAGNLSERDLFALQGYLDLVRAERVERGEKDMDVLESKVAELEIYVKAELAWQHVRNEKDDFTSFNHAVDEYWGDVVPDSEAPDVPCSLERMSDSMKKDLWSLRINHRLKPFVLEMHTAESTQERTKEFLELAWKSIGPVFLERAEEDILNGRYVPLDNKQHQPESNRKNKSIRKTLLSSLEDEGRPESRLEDSDSPNVPPPWTGEESRPEKRTMKRLRSSDEEVEKAVKELKENQLDLKQNVNDPLPEAIEMAKKLRKGTDDQAAPQSQAEAPADQNKKSNIMERNSTARTRQWNEDDEIEMSVPEKETSPSASKGLSLDAPNTKKVSPLNSRSLPARRKMHKWTLKEEEALRRGVEQFGKGRWKHILLHHQETFENRTEVDLKDKWRNIEKSEGIKRD